VGERKERGKTEVVIDVVEVGTEESRRGKEGWAREVGRRSGRKERGRSESIKQLTTKRTVSKKYGRKGLVYGTT